MKSSLKTTILLFSISIFYGCAVPKKILHKADFDNVVLLPIKFHKQTPRKCGIAALASVLYYFKIDYSGIDGIYNKEEKGTKLIAMVNFANRYIDAKVEHSGFEGIVNNIDQGRPVILMRKLRRYHYFVIKGYIANQRKIVTNDGYDENVLLDIPGAKGGENSDILITFRFYSKPEGQF